MWWWRRKRSRSAWWRYDGEGWRRSDRMMLCSYVEAVALTPKHNCIDHEVCAFHNYHHHQQTRSINFCSQHPKQPPPLVPSRKTQPAAPYPAKSSRPHAHSRASPPGPRETEAHSEPANAPGSASSPPRQRTGPDTPRRRTQTPGSPAPCW